MLRYKHNSVTLDSHAIPMIHLVSQRNGGDRKFLAVWWHRGGDRAAWGAIVPPRRRPPLHLQPTWMLPQYPCVPMFNYSNACNK